jgi:hypothetical protein
VLSPGQQLLAPLVDIKGQNLTFSPECFEAKDGPEAISDPAPFAPSNAWQPIFENQTIQGLLKVCSRHGVRRAHFL